MAYVQNSTLYKDKPLDLLGFRREIVNVYRMKYSTEQRGKIRPPHEINLFKGRLNENRVPTSNEAIQRKGDMVSVVKNQNMFAQNVMSHFVSIVFKIITNLSKEH